jgi:hypothetical protein
MGANMREMKAIRIVFTIALASVGIIPIRGPLAPEAPRSVRWIGPNEGLAARLRQKGKDPRLYLIWEGYPLHIEQSESISLAAPASRS